MSILSNVLRILANPKRFSILEIIALSEIDPKFLITHLNLSKSEYHSSISCLLKNGIITKKSGKFSLTSFGQVLSNAQNLIGAALNDYWKLNAIDSLETPHFLPSAEYYKIVNRLVRHEMIREVLTGRRRSRTTDSAGVDQVVENISPSIQGTFRGRPER